MDVGLASSEPDSLLAAYLKLIFPNNPPNLKPCVAEENNQSVTCTTFQRYPIFSKRYSVLCKVYTGYCGTSEIEHGLCTCTVNNPLAKARGLSLRTGAQTMLYLPLVSNAQPTRNYGTCIRFVIYDPFNSVSAITSQN